MTAKDTLATLVNAPDMMPYLRVGCRKSDNGTGSQTMTETGRFHPSDNPLAGPSGLPAFFSRRWNGEVPLGQLFWRDMVTVGSLINVATTIAALLILAAKMSALLAVAVHLIPLPYNLFLYGSVLRTADMAGTPNAGTIKLGATLWIILASLL